MDSRKCNTGVRKSLQTPACSQPVNTSMGSTMQPKGMHKNDQKLFEFFEKMLSKEGLVDLSQPKVKEYINSFSKNFHRRIHYFGGLGKFLSFNPRFCVSLNVVRLSTPMKQSIPAPLKQSIPTPLKQVNEMELEENDTPKINPWKIDPPRQNENSNDCQFRVVPDNDFSPNIISIKSGGNNHTLLVSENNSPQVRLFHTRDHRQTEEPSELVQTRDDAYTSSHGVPLQTSSLRYSDWLQPMVQNTSESQTQVHDTPEEHLDQHSDKLFFPSAYDRNELDTTSLVTEFTESLSSSQTASTSEEEPVVDAFADSASLVHDFVGWLPTRENLINSLEIGLPANSSTVLLPINNSAMTGYPANWTPITDLHMKWPPINGLPMSWSQIIARPQKSIPGPSMDSSAGLAVCLSENMSHTGFVGSRLQATRLHSKSPTELAECRLQTGFNESRSQAGFTESRSMTGYAEGQSSGFIVYSSPRAEFTGSRSSTAFAERSQTAGLLEMSHTPRFTDNWTQTRMLTMSSLSRDSNECLSPRFPNESHSVGLFDNRSTWISDDSSSTVLYGNLTGTELRETLQPTTRPLVYSSPSRELPVSPSPVRFATNSTPKESALNSRLAMSSLLTSELPPSGLSEEHSYVSAINEHSLHANNMNDIVSPVKTVLEERSAQNCFESPYENGSHKFNIDQTKHSRQSLFQSVEPADSHLDQSSNDQWSIGKMQSINTFLSLPNLISEVNLILTDFKNRICALNIPTLPQNSFSADYGKDSGHKVMSSEAGYRLVNLPGGNCQYPNSSCFSSCEAPGCNCQSGQVRGNLDYPSAQGLIDVEIETDIDGSVHNKNESTVVEPQVDINGTVYNEGEFTTDESETYINVGVHNEQEFTGHDSQTDFNGIADGEIEFTAVKPQTYINGTLDDGTEFKNAETQSNIGEILGNEDEYKAFRIIIINGAAENVRGLKDSDTQTDVIGTFNNGSEFKGVKIQIDISGTGGNGRTFTTLENRTAIDGSVYSKECKAVETQTDIDGMGQSRREFKDMETQTGINETVERELQEVKVVHIQTDFSGMDIEEQFTQLNFLKETQTICTREYEELVKENEATKDVVKTLQEQLQNLQEELDLTKFENHDLDRQIVHLTYVLEKNEKAEAYVSRMCLNDFDCKMATKQLQKTNHEDMADVKHLHKGKSKKKHKGRKARW